MHEKFIQIDCDERITTKGVDFKSSALDNVLRAQVHVPQRSFNLNEVALYAYCPVAKALRRKNVHIDLLPNMAMERADSDLATMSLEFAKDRILQTKQFICRPFNAQCPKGFK